MAALHPEVASALGQAAAQAMHRELVAELGQDDRPLPVGSAPLTELPAADAVASGSVERSNRYPNSSYFRNWTSTDAALTWDIEVRPARRLRGDDLLRVSRAGCRVDRGAGFQSQRTTAR